MSAPPHQGQAGVPEQLGPQLGLPGLPVLLQAALSLQSRPRLQPGQLLLSAAGQQAVRPAGGKHQHLQGLHGERHPDGGPRHHHHLHHLLAPLQGQLAPGSGSLACWAVGGLSGEIQFRYNNNIYRHAGEDMMQGEENIIIDTSSGSVNTSKPREEDGEER